jgi:hypothetical protein
MIVSETSSAPPLDKKEAAEEKEMIPLFLLRYRYQSSYSWTQCCGSDPVLFYLRDPGWSNGRIRIRDKQTKFVNSLYTKRGRIRDPVRFYPPDPGSGSGMEQWSNPDPGSGIKHPGSATLRGPIGIKYDTFLLFPLVEAEKAGGTVPVLRPYNF